MGLVTSRSLPTDSSPRPTPVRARPFVHPVHSVHRVHCVRPCSSLFARPFSSHPPTQQKGRPAGRPKGESKMANHKSPDPLLYYSNSNRPEFRVIRWSPPSFSGKGVGGLGQRAWVQGTMFAPQRFLVCAVPIRPIRRFRPCPSLCVRARPWSPFPFLPILPPNKKGDPQVAPMENRKWQITNLLILSCITATQTDPNSATSGGLPLPFRGRGSGG